MTEKSKYDGISGNEIISLEAGDSWVSKAIYNPHSNWLASAAGRQLRLWDTNREVFASPLIILVQSLTLAEP